jgi:hypothetical protein
LFFLYFSKKNKKMRTIIIIFAFSLFSCNQKQEKLENISKEKDIVSNQILDNQKTTYSKNKRSLIGQIYNDNSFNFIGLPLNYGYGKYIFLKKEMGESYLIDTIVTKTENIELEDILYRPEDYPEHSIKISDFTYAVIKSDGILSMGLFKQEKIDNWKCIDVIEVDKISDTSEHPFILGKNREFSYICETNKGHYCCAVVMDKINASGKYEKVLKAYKFDLANGKIIEIDLKKEKVECEPEGSCE